MARRLLWASLALAPITLIVDLALHPSKTVLFVLSALALVPLAWLIGEATEHAGEHTGPGIGGFLNASFGNAPELIIALLAVADGLPDVVRGSITGSIVSNILLVLGAAMVFGVEARLDRRSLVGQLALVGLAVLLFLVPAVPGFNGDPERHSLALLSLVPAGLLFVVYVWYTTWSLRRHAAAYEGSSGKGWSLPVALAALAAATALTAAISEILVHSLDAFAEAAGLSEFFIAAVIVAIVGNAAEHGGAVVIASRGKMKLATEIAISSSAQVGLFVAPFVTIVSFAFPDALPLSFRPIELAAMGGAAAFVAVVVADGRSRRWEGFLLIGVYVLLAVVFGLVGDRSRG